MKSDWLVRITVESEVLLNKFSRRDKGDGTIRLRSDGRWEARYSIGYDPKTGKQIQKSIYGKTKVAVKNKLNEILQDIENDEYIEPNHIKLGDWLDTWIEDYSFDKKYLTLKGYKAQIKKHIKPVLGKYYLNQISPVMVQHFYNSLSRPDDEGRILSPKSIKNVHTILQAALNQAVENEYIKKNPCAKARLPKVEKAAIKPLDLNKGEYEKEKERFDEVSADIDDELDSISREIKKYEDIADKSETAWRISDCIRIRDDENAFVKAGIIFIIICIVLLTVGKIRFRNRDAIKDNNFIIRQEFK